ncbi:MAG: hypothetical protein BA865_01545 [Desulfobacterales bacterium S5133MH4]|nr:MAG: hypothetical protein BA865_01545 [Desulfobacterales bacterium S5133MH4]
MTVCATAQETIPRNLILMSCFVLCGLGLENIPYFRVFVMGFEWFLNRTVRKSSGICPETESTCRLRLLRRYCRYV